MTSSCCCCLCTAAIIFGLVQVNCILARSWTRAAPMSRLQWDESNVAHVSPHCSSQWVVAGGGSWVWSLLLSKIACPKTGQVKCCVKISSGQTSRQVHKSGLSSGLGKGYSANGGVWVRFAVLGFGIALRAQHNRFGMRIAECGRHYRQTQTLYELNASLVFPIFLVFPFFLFSYAAWLPNDLARMLVGRRRCCLGRCHKICSHYA